MSNAVASGKEVAEDTDLLRLHCVSELGRERDVGDRDIIQHKVETQCTARQVLPDQTRDLEVHQHRIQDRDYAPKE